MEEVGEECELRWRLDEAEEESGKEGGGGGVAVLDVRFRLREEEEEVASSGCACGGWDEAMYEAMARGAKVRIPQPQLTAHRAAENYECLMSVRQHKRTTGHDHQRDLSRRR